MILHFGLIIQIYSTATNIYLNEFIYRMHLLKTYNQYELYIRNKQPIIECLHLYKEKPALYYIRRQKLYKFIV